MQRQQQASTRVSCHQISDFPELKIAHFKSVCLLASFPIATAAGKAQVPWLDAIETRLAATAQALGNFKLVRMTGLTESVSSNLRSLRSAEISAARRYRIFNIFLSIGCKGPRQARLC